MKSQEVICITFAIVWLILGAVSGRQIFITNSAVYVAAFLVIGATKR